MERLIIVVCPILIRSASERLSYKLRLRINCKWLGSTFVRTYIVGDTSNWGHLRNVSSIQQTSPKQKKKYNEWCLIKIHEDKIKIGLENFWAQEFFKKYDTWRGKYNILSLKLVYDVNLFKINEKKGEVLKTSFWWHSIELKRETLISELT